MHITNLGTEVNPDKIAQAASSDEVEAILISTHNGMALDYGKHLKIELGKHKVDVPVVMGGVLNQKEEAQALPVDVTSQLKELGFYASPKLEGNFRKLLEHDVMLKST